MADRASYPATVDERIEQLLRSYRRMPGIQAAVAVWALTKLQRTRTALLNVAANRSTPENVRAIALRGLGVASPEQLSPDDFPPDDQEVPS